MADTTTVMALPFPEGSDANDVPADMQALAERLDEAPGIESLTSAEIAALAAGEKPAGRVVYNSTTSKLQVSNGTSFADVDAAALLKAGGTMSGNIAMGSNKVTGLAAATTNGDAVRYEQALLLAGGTMAGNINANGNKVTGLAAASANGEAVRYDEFVTTKNTADAALPKAGGTMSGNLNMNNAGYILNILPSGASNDAATVGQVNDVSASFVGGVTSGTTDSDSVITISLPTSPTGQWAVTYNANVAGGMHVNYGNGDDFFKVRFYNSGGSPVGAGQNYTVRWNAIAY